MTINFLTSFFAAWYLQQFLSVVSVWRLIARKLAVLFDFNRGVQPFHAACHFDELRAE
jgi:hypothetical protein